MIPLASAHAHTLALVWLTVSPVDRYTRPGLLPRAARPSRRARPRLIRDPTHPSYDPEAGQCGLFASRPLARGAWVLDYVGEVSAGGCEDRDSDYVSDFGERAELALDADKVEMDPNI